jgi:tetratricopeptide (TPR) repeat protein
MSIMRTSVLLAGLLVLSGVVLVRAEPAAEERAMVVAELQKAWGEFARFYAQGKMEAALNRAEKTLALARQLFPKEQFPDGHVFLAGSLNNVGLVLEALGRLEGALEHKQQALAMFRKVFPPERFPDGHNVLAQSLNNVGGVLGSLGRLEGALEHHQQALAMRRKLFPPDKFPDGHNVLAASLNNLGNVLESLGRLKEALECYQQALATSRKLFPPDKFPDGHNVLAGSLNNLGNVLESLGRLEGALEHKQQALAMFRKLFPPERFSDGHQDLAASLNGVGNVLKSLGRLEGALEHQQQALAMNRKLFPPDKFPDGHNVLAQCLNNVGSVLCSLGRLESALEHYQQALAMSRNLFPSDKFPNGHNGLAQSLNNVGSVLGSLGRLEGALEHFQQALAMFRKLFPPERFPDGHHDLATSLNNVGGVLWSLGRLEGALEHQQQALAMSRKLFPPDKFPDGHNVLAISMNGVGFVLLTRGQPAAAAEVLAKALRMQCGLIDQQALGVSEAEALGFARATYSSLNSYLSATAVRPDAAAASYDLIWSQRGAVSRILRQRHLAALAAAAANPEIRAHFERLQQTGHELAALLRAPLPDSSEAQKSRDQRVNELTQSRQRLQRELVALLPEVDRQRKLDHLGPQDLAQALPRDATFVDLRRYYRWVFDPNKPGLGGLKVSARYLAFVVSRDRPVQRVELGEAQTIEEALADWRYLIEQGRDQDQPKPAQALRRLLWEPLREALPPSNRSVFLAPDAALTRLPFAALPGRKLGTVLLEDHALAVVPHGPFLLEQLTSPARFDKGRHSALALGRVGYSDTPTPLEAVAAIRGPEREGAPLAWTDLPGSARELQLLQGLYGDQVTRLAGKQADVTRLMQALPRAALAHLSTHGFFNERLFREEEQRREQQVDSLLLSHDLVGGRLGSRVTLGAHNPLSYVGLVLAGANKAKEAGSHGGILTGDALLGLDLRGLELCVLSACQTGLGDVFNGECVHNLQQAFHSAGCPNVVASLWSVPDEATAALMGLFYHGLLEKKLPPLEALRSAQLYLSRHPEQIPELSKRLDRGAPLVTQGAPYPEPDPKPLPSPTGDTKRAPVKSWAGFVLSGVGR